MRMSWPYNKNDPQVKLRSLKMRSSRTIITSGSSSWNLEIRYMSRARSLGTVSIFILYKTSIQLMLSITRSVLHEIQPLWLDRMEGCIRWVWSRLEEARKDRHRDGDGLTYQRNSFDTDVLVHHYPTEIVDERDQPHKSPTSDRFNTFRFRLLSLTSVSCVRLLGKVTSDKVNATNGGGGAVDVLISILVICRSGAA